MCDIPWDNGPKNPPKKTWTPIKFSTIRLGSVIREVYHHGTIIEEKKK